MFDPTVRLRDPSFQPDRKLTEEAWKAACGAADHLLASGAASAVRIWGSLMIVDEFHEHSDLDLYVTWQRPEEKARCRERCHEIAHPFPVEFTTAPVKYSPIRHPGVMFSEIGQVFQPEPLSAVDKLRFLQNRMDRRSVKVDGLQRQLKEEGHALRQHGRDDLLTGLVGYHFQTFRMMLTQLAGKVLWTIDRSAWPNVESARILELASREIPGLRPEFLSPALAQTLSADEVDEDSLQEWMTEGEQAMRRYSGFLAEVIAKEAD